jgi:class 3 adenylate cyclase
MHLEVTSMYTGGKFVMTCSDVTLPVRYETLIESERERSDRYLQAILPPSIVKRVQAQEENISFQVPMASILFMDIVEFTPWCGESDPAKVMRTLNAMFKKLDALLGAKKTLTKIKCIGDCYMAAGGIFSDASQVAEHANETVMFGLESIKALVELNKELHEHLRIRVGVHTGGPIAAGVLGVGKPTFEIIGPAINMAQQMEHYGEPMHVQVTRQVQELIKGGRFPCTEKQIEIDGKSVLVYIITPMLK